MSEPPFNPSKISDDELRAWAGASKKTSHQSFAEATTEMTAKITDAAGARRKQTDELMQATEDMIRAERALEEEAKRTKESERELDRITEQLQREMQGEATLPQPISEKREKEMDAVMEYMKLKMRQDKQEAESKMAHEQMAEVVDIINNASQSTEALDLFKALNTPQEQRTSAQRNLVSCATTQKGPQKPLNKPFLNLVEFKNSLAEALVVSQSEHTTQRLLQLQDKANRCDASDCEATTNLMTELVTIGLETESEDALQRIYGNKDAPATDPFKAVDMSHITTTAERKVKKVQKVEKVNPAPTENLHTTPLTKPAVERLTDAAEALVTVQEGSVDATILQVFLAKANLQYIHGVTVRYVPQSKQTTMEYSVPDGTEVPVYSVAGVLPICKTLCTLLPDAEFMYPTSSPYLFGIVEASLEAVRPVMQIAKTILTMEGAPRGGWFQRKVADGGPSLEYVLSALQRELEKVDAAHYAQGRGGGLALCTVSATLADAVLLGSLMVLKGSGFDASHVNCNKVAFAFESAITTRELRAIAETWLVKDGPLKKDILHHLENPSVLSTNDHMFY